MVSVVHGLGQRTVYSRDVAKLIKIINDSQPWDLTKSTMYMGVREYGNEG